MKKNIELLQIFFIIILFILYKFINKNNDNDNFTFRNLSEYDASADGYIKFPYLDSNYNNDIINRYYSADDNKHDTNVISYLNNGLRVSGIRTVNHPYQQKTGKYYGGNQNPVLPVRTLPSKPAGTCSIL